uniref:Uncharacterized protein n=1 Tax=Glossina austeni TaxID=7395 RepID=A0A1A9V2K0_GLOAU
MDFSYVEFPSTVSLNVLKAYVDLKKCKLPKIDGLSWQDAGVHQVLANQPKSLRHLVLDSIANNWNETSIFEEVPREEDRNYIVNNLDVNLPLKILSSRIKDEFFWRKIYQHRWKTLYYKKYNNNAEQPHHHHHHHHHHHRRRHQANTNETKGKKATRKPWINIYMERHLEEFIENLTTTDYEQENVQATLDICATYINQLEINYLQTSMDGQHDHIPLDFILSNLPELHTLRLTYCTKTIGMNFYLGCNVLSQRDTFHNTKLEPHQLRLFAHSLDKGCHHLNTLALPHCALGDEGIRQFLDACHSESFTAEGAYILSGVIKDLSLEELILRLNPIGSNGATTIFSILDCLPIKNLDISGCLLTDSITKSFMQLVVTNKSLICIDVSNNVLGKLLLNEFISTSGILPTIETRQEQQQEQQQEQEQGAPMNSNNNVGYFAFSEKGNNPSTPHQSTEDIGVGPATTAGTILLQYDVKMIISGAITLKCNTEV